MMAAREANETIVMGTNKLSKVPAISLQKRRKNEQGEREYSEELIRPCLCDSTWHRCCIRELIVKTESIECPLCQFQYTVGYTDCWAMFNKKRPNYIYYMFIQEVFLWVSLVLYCLACFLFVQWFYANENPF